MRDVKAETEDARKLRRDGFVLFGVVSIGIRF
jgi:hypothetical protein